MLAGLRLHIIQIIISFIIGVRLLVDSTNMTFLQEANPGDPSDSVSLCLTTKADVSLVLMRNITVNFELTGGTAGMHKQMIVCVCVCVCVCVMVYCCHWTLVYCYQTHSLNTNNTICIALYI